MKKIYGFAALSAAMLLASCSNNDEPNVVTPGEGDSIAKSYLAINLSAPSDDTRAITAGETDPSEYAVANVQFAVFDEAKKLVMITDEYEDFTWGNSTDIDVDKQSSKKILEIKQADAASVGYVMAILNTPGLSTMGFTVGSSTIDDVRKKIGDYNTITGKDNKTYYVMSNSAYEDTETIGTVKTDYTAYATSFRGHVYPTMGQAIDDAVNIYVERVAARCDLTNNDKSKGNTVTIPDADAVVNGSAAKIEVKITGVDFIYDPNKSYLVKSIDEIPTDISNKTWYTEGSHRTHWADAPKLAWNKDATKSDYTQATYSAAEINGAVGETTMNFYLHENVTENPTYVVITGDIYVNDQKNVAIYQLWQDGKYYTEEGAKKELCGYLKANGYQYYYENDDVKSTKDITIDDVTFKPSTTTDFEAYISINLTAEDENKNTLKLCKGTTAQTSESGVLTMATDQYKALVYGGGKTYYYCPIAPKLNGENEDGVEGVIRNHIYNIEFGTIMGLGVPLYDPKGELLPKDPKTNEDKSPKWYFNATINILKWKVYKQTMNFGN